MRVLLVGLFTVGHVISSTISYAILTGGGLLVAGFLLWWVLEPYIRPLSHRDDD